MSELGVCSISEDKRHHASSGLGESFTLMSSDLPDDANVTWLIYRPQNVANGELHVAHYVLQDMIGANKHRNRVVLKCL